MSLREEMWKYEQITGESAEHVPIIKLGAFLDGYEKGIKALGRTSCKSEARRWKRRYLDLKQRIFKMEERTSWIPVSERLPKDHENVLIYLSSNRITIGLYNSHRLPFMDNPIGWGADAPHDWTSDEVVAWMPLPQRYEVESKIEQAVSYADQDTLMSAT